jgi:hypothetical protein
MTIDLKALLATARVEARINSPKAAIKARIAQRTAAELAADAYARDLEKRASLQRGLSCESIDAMRFRWLAEHSVHWEQLAGLTLDELRRKVDLMIKQEAIRRLSEMRRDQRQKEFA